MSLPTTYDDMRKLVPYYGDNELIHSQLARVLTTLPKSVTEFVFAHVVFLSLHAPGSASRLPLSTQPAVVWLIQLAEDIPYVHSKRYRKFAERDICHIIAHEIAHGWLEFQGTKPADAVDLEIACGDLAEQWGFPHPAKERLEDDARIYYRLVLALVETAGSANEVDIEDVVTKFNEGLPHPFWSGTSLGYRLSDLGFKERRGGAVVMDRELLANISKEYWYKKALLRERARKQ